MDIAMRAVDLVRTLRAQAGLRTRQPIGRLWLALPGGDIAEREALLALIAAEVNVKTIELIGDESELVERRVKVLLPKVGKRLGSKIPEVMEAARDGRFEIHPDGSVTIAGISLAADEVEIQASPKPGTAVAHDQGLVAVIDTELTPELIAEGDARELQRAIQDLRKDAGLALDDRIEVWVDGLPSAVEVHLDAVATETLADRIHVGQSAAEDPGIVRESVLLSGKAVSIALRRVNGVLA
jgi:isoleucyl-tRNA synthetase